MTSPFAADPFWRHLPPEVHPDPSNPDEWRPATSDETAAWETAQIDGHVWADLTVPITPKETT